MKHDHDVPDVGTLFSQPFWDTRYASTERLWSGRPNQRLVENVADRAPGMALDLGSGEGADAIWLARRGWQVTALDVSPVALERSARHARDAGAQVAARITWQRADLLSFDPTPAKFDLVSEQFLQLPREVRGIQHRRWADAVRPGGMLLIVGHHPSDLDTTMPHPHVRDLFFTAEDEAAGLDLDGWVVAASAARREAIDPDGHRVTITDAVLRAERPDQAIARDVEH